MADPGSIKVYALSTCSHCKALLSFLEKNNFTFESVNVDELLGKERRDMIREVKLVNKRCSFPTTVVGDHVIVGFKEDELRTALGV